MSPATADLGLGLLAGEAKPRSRPDAILTSTSGSWWCCCPAQRAVAKGVLRHAIPAHGCFATGRRRAGYPAGHPARFCIAAGVNVSFA